MKTTELRTGDVVLFYNRNTWLSWTIALFDWSDCSHVGLVLKDPPIDGLAPGTYLLESGFEDFGDVEDHAASIYGVRLSKLDDVLRAYGSTDIHARRLRATPGPVTDAMVRKLHAAVHGKPYDMQITHWVEFALGAHGKRTDREFQCAALVTYALTVLGVVPPTVDWTFATPADYGRRVDALPLLPGAEWDPQLHPLEPADGW